MSAAITLPPSPLAVDDIRLGDVALWARPDAEREAIFKLLRDEASVTFHAEPEMEGILRGPGFWAVTRHADVQHVSRHPELYCSGRGGSNIGDIPQEMAEYLGSIINMDDPRHRKLRGIVSAGFTPREIQRLEADVAQRAHEVIDTVASRGECDFVADIAAPLPLRIICDMAGVPEELAPVVLKQSNIILGVGDLELVGNIADLMGAFFTLHQMATELGEQRLKNPTDDLTSRLMHAEVDGERLTVAEFASFFILLVVAGNETTRTAISHGMWAFQQFPHQKEFWLEDYDDRAQLAVEEIVRWGTPVIHFRRTATQDSIMGDREIAAGDKVVIFFNSANRDERALPDPFRFDLARTPNPHMGFGGGGPHFCLGANLARREIKTMFEEIFRRLPDLEITAEPDILQSAFIHGIKRMPCRFTPGT